MLRLVLAEGIPLGVIGVALGLAGAGVLRKLIVSLLYGVSEADPVAFGSAALLLLGIALAATLTPARRATLVDPARTIRVE